MIFFISQQVLLILMLLSSWHAFAVDNPVSIFEDLVKAFEEKNKNDIVCDKIKELNPYDSRSKFEEVVAAMRNRNLTTCDCIKYLTEQAIKEIMDKEFPLLGEAEKKEISQAPNYNGNIGKVHCDTNIPSEFCDVVRTMYVGKDNLFVREDNSSSNKSGAYAGNNIIGLDIQRSKTWSRSGLRHVARHETTHINFKHGMKELYLHNKGSDSSILEFGKAQEGQAEIVSAACNGLQAAYDCEQYLYRVYKSRLDGYQLKKQAQKRLFLSNPSMYVNYNKFAAYEEAFDSKHPVSTRLLHWAIIVRKLREIEEMKKQPTT